MAILNIRPAVREGARVVIGLSGVSGSGKTYTALQLAWGLAKGDASKVGLLDTENKRGSLYSDILVNSKKEIQQFMIGDLYPPFSPQRYATAIKEFQEAGVEVLVVDSGSHEWEGEGGCEDIADDGGKVANWKKAKREHKRFMNVLLSCDMHIIVCLRAREKTSFKDPRKPESLGIQPICEKNFMFEMTASLLIQEQGMYRDILKCPAELLPILDKKEGYLGAKEGLALRKWIDGGKQLDPAVERARNTIMSRTSEGLEVVNQLWADLDNPTKKALGQQFLDTARSSAQEFDDQAAARNPHPDDDLDMSSGGFDPMAPVQREFVPAHEQPVHGDHQDDDVFGQDQQ